MRTDSDPDVKPYIFDKDIEWKYVTVPVEMKGLKQLMEKVLANRLDKLRELVLFRISRNTFQKGKCLTSGAIADPA